MICENCKVCYEYFFFWNFWRYYLGKSVQIIVFLFCACILRWYPMELVHDIIFFLFFDVQNIEKCVTNIINIFDIIWKKCRTWILKHSCKGPNHNFFLICTCILRCYSMELVHEIIFFGFFDVQTIEKMSHKYH